MQLTTAQLTRLADEAYGMAVSSDHSPRRSYAAGVEDLARYLLGDQNPTAMLRWMLDDAERGIGPAEDRDTQFPRYAARLARELGHTLTRIPLPDDEHGPIQGWTCSCGMRAFLRPLENPPGVYGMALSDECPRRS